MNPQLHPLVNFCWLDFGSGSVSGYGGGLNGSTQHSVRTHLALKTKAKIAR